MKSAMNAFGKTLSLTDSEKVILQLFDRYGKDKTFYNDDVESWFDYKCIYCTDKKYQWIINASKLDGKDFINSFYHLLINGIIEKEYWNKKDITAVCFRIPIKKRNYYVPQKRYTSKKLDYFDNLYLKQKEKSYNEWMNNHSGK